MLKTFLQSSGCKVHQSRAVSSSARLYSDLGKQKVDKADYKNHRLEALEQVVKYPHKFNASISVEQLLDKFAHLKTQEKSAEQLSVCGMVTSVREMSKKLKFVDIVGGGQKVQLKISSASFGSFEDFISVTKNVARGDRIGKAGFKINFNYHKIISVRDICHLPLSKLRPEVDFTPP